MTTQVGSAAAGPLTLIFAVNNGMITRAIAGLSDEELWRRPSEQSNPMFWLLGHIVHTRGGLLRVLGDDYRTGWGDKFRRGASLMAAAEYPTLAEIERVRSDVFGRVQARLAAVSDEHLNQLAAGSLPPGVKTIADLVSFLAFHESYHVGQLAFVRKLLGHSAVAG